MEIKFHCRRLCVFVYFVAPDATSILYTRLFQIRTATYICDFESKLNYYWRFVDCVCVLYITGNAYKTVVCVCVYMFLTLILLIF